jgi:hypothetical protein
MNSYHILIQPTAVYVKESDFFKSQGGLEEDWGKNWQQVYADSIEHARTIGKRMRDIGGYKNGQ